MSERDSHSTFTVAVVQRQVDAYNARHLDHFVDCYSIDAVIVAGTDHILARGHAQIRAMYGRLFEEYLSLHAHIAARIHLGEWVIDEEHLRRTTRAGVHHEIRAAVLYQVRDGKITRSQILQ